MFDLSTRRLYLCVGVRDDMVEFLTNVLREGVDVVQLREKRLDASTLLAPARQMAAVCRDHDVPFIVNDSPALALEAGADGVHVGQDDESVERCRQLLGASSLVGLSTHADAEFDDALTRDATYFSAGPIEPTPTKLGRAGTGVEYAVRSQARCPRPVFVTGNVNVTNVRDLVAHGLRHFVVVRALTESPDPARATRELRRVLDDAFSTVAIEPT